MTILILNPLFSCVESNNQEIKGYRDLIIDPDTESFLAAMQYINTSNLNQIFLLADTPPHIQQYPELFNKKSDIRNKHGVNNLRHLNQFNEKIRSFYKEFLPEALCFEQINVITTSRCYNELSSLSNSEIKKLPKCKIKDRVGKFSCSAIASIACKIALDSYNSSELIVFASKSNTRTPLDIVYEGVEHAKKYWKKNIKIKIST